MDSESIIHLNNVRLDPDEYVRLAMWLDFWPRVLRMGAALILLGIGTYILHSDIIYGVAGGTAVLVPFAILARWGMLNKFKRNPENRKVWGSRQMSFDAYKLYMATDDGISNEVPFPSFIKARIYKGHYLLYITSLQYLPLPTSAFKSDRDEEKFKGLLDQNGLFKKKGQK